MRGFLDGSWLVETVVRHFDGVAIGSMALASGSSALGSVVRSTG